MPQPPRPLPSLLPRLLLLLFLIPNNVCLVQGFQHHHVVTTITPSFRPFRTRTTTRTTFSQPQFQPQQQHQQHQQQQHGRGIVHTTALSALGTIPSSSNSNKKKKKKKNSNNDNDDSQLSSSSSSSPYYFQVQLNEFFKRPVPEPIKHAVSIYREKEYYENEQQQQQQDLELVSLLTAAPSVPMVPRPLWLVMLGSLPTGLLWYGYYKFAVEEELLQWELDHHQGNNNNNRAPRGFGGYGTLGPFCYGILLGFVAEYLHWPGGIQWATLGVVYIYYTQFLLYDRVNELFRHESNNNNNADIEQQQSEQQLPLQVWWCLPIFFPFNLIVGLRQVHFLSEYCYRQRGIDPPPNDPVADFFPFIKAPRYTWQEFLLTPRLWCQWLEDVPPIDPTTLPTVVQDFLALGGNSTFTLSF